MDSLKRVRNIIVLVILFLSLGLNCSVTFAEKEVQKPSNGTLKRLEAEIMEVEELKEPKGSVIFTVKDLSSGATLRLFADPYTSLVQMGGSQKQAGDVLGGSKVTIIYRKSPDRDIPEIIFAKVTSSYYS